MGKHAVLTANAIDWTRRIAGFISTILVSKIIYSIVEHRKFTPESSLALAQLIVVIYFVSWFWAALKGIKTQANILNSTGGISSKMPVPGIFALLIGFPIGSLAMALVLFGERFKSIVPSCNSSITELLVYLLAIFWLWDMAWHFLVRKSVRRMVSSSKENLRQEDKSKMYFGIEKINALEAFIFGHWRISRIAFGIIVILFLIFLMHSIENYAYIPKFDISIHLDAAISMTTFAFVLVSEGWIWFMRIRMSTTIDTLERLEILYDLEKKHRKK